MHRAKTKPPVGPCALSALPEPYQTAFRQGSAHHLPGDFLPVQTDWFIQIFMLPFILLYALPVITLGPALINQAIRQPASYLRFFQTVAQQSPAQIILTLLLLLLATLLVLYCAYQSWDMAQSFYRTWDAHRVRKQGGEAYGLVLLPHGIVGRLVDSINGHNCLWLPRSAIANVVWQRMREEGAKHSRWVNRTRIGYETENSDRNWITLKGTLVQMGYANGDPHSDQALYDTLKTWWRPDP